MGQLDIEKMLQWVVTAGIVLAVVLVCIGGAIYLYHQGSEEMVYTFIPENVLSTESLPELCITLAVFVLAFTQILRVAVVGYYFYKLQDILFTLISLFIFIFLTISIVWPIFL